ncbi:MAG: B12-binding domain-containing radical SAM protein [Oscillospiraceae bacterium]|nr:B12-binding domain-containing radical SAM protein [Oscillospiraceae bacterium]
MSKIVIVAINAKYVHSSLAAWVIAAGISKYAHNHHDIQIVEATIHNDNAEIANRIAAYAPDIVSISAYIWNASKLPGILSLLKEKLPSAQCILGGPEAVYNERYWLKNGADFVLHGEGEYTFPAFLNQMEQETCHISKTDVIPVDPYTDEYFSTLQGRLAYLETSRGCPFTCAFCLSAGTHVQYFPMETVKAQLLKLSKSDARTIKLVDRTFNCNAQRAYEIFDYMISLETDCCFHFEVAADLFDDRTIALLQSAPPGRIQLEAGLQSFFEPALNASSRKTSLDRVAQNIKALLSAGNIHMHVDLIAGLPHETLGDFKNSFNAAFSLRAHILQLGFLKLLHGSALRKQASELGIVFNEHPPYEIISSPWLSMEDIQILKHAENALQHTYNKGRFITSIEYVLKVTKLRPFDLFYTIGASAPNHGTDLSAYAIEILDICLNLPHVDERTLLDSMVYDWLGMVKGKNMPDRLKNPDIKRNQVVSEVEAYLGRKIRRDEAAVLRSGGVIYVDSRVRNPVTGLYEVRTLPTTPVPPCTSPGHQP